MLIGPHNYRCLHDFSHFFFQLKTSFSHDNVPYSHKVADVSEAVRQFADALMLSGESAIGSFGQKALSVLHTTSSRMELWSREKNQHNGLHQRQLGLSLAEKIAEQICNCAVEMGNFWFSHHAFTNLRVVF